MYFNTWEAKLVQGRVKATRCPPAKRKLPRSQTRQQTVNSQSLQLPFEWPESITSPSQCSSSSGGEMAEGLNIALDSTLKHKNGFILEWDENCPREAESWLFSRRHFTAILPRFLDFSFASVCKQMDYPPQSSLDTHVHTHKACEARQNKA